MQGPSLLVCLQNADICREVIRSRVSQLLQENDSLGLRLKFRWMLTEGGDCRGDGQGYQGASRKMFSRARPQACVAQQCAYQGSQPRFNSLVRCLVTDFR